MEHSTPCTCWQSHERSLSCPRCQHARVQQVGSWIQGPNGSTPQQDSAAFVRDNPAAFLPSQINQDDPRPAQQTSRSSTVSSEAYRQTHSQPPAVASLATDEARRMTAIIAQGLHERDVERQNVLRRRRQNNSQLHDDTAQEAASSHRSADVSSDAERVNDDDGNGDESSDTDDDSISDDDEDNDKADVATDHYAYRRRHG